MLKNLPDLFGLAADTGGLNIGNEYFRADPGNPAGYWRDQDVVVRGAVLRSMIEPGHPCVTISGSASACWERT